LEGVGEVRRFLRALSIGVGVKSLDLECLIKRFRGVTEYVDETVVLGEISATVIGEEGAGDVFL
jgi:hypothetical protein